MTKTTIYLVRHGESEHNRDGVISGHVDPLLTDEGRQQVRQTAALLKERGVRFDEVYCSPMKRAVETASIIAGRDVFENNRIEGLKERAFGELDGKPESLLEGYRKVRDTMSHEEAWVHKFVEGMESDHEVSLRITDALKKLARNHPGETILVVGHGGAIRTTIMKIKNLSHKELPAGSVKNAGFVKLSYDGSDLSVDEIKA